MFIGCGEQICINVVGITIVDTVHLFLPFEGCL